MSRVLTSRRIHHVLYENESFVGGVWRYNDTQKREIDKEEFTNPMYSSLRTNLPVEIMAYSMDMPFVSSSTSSYEGHGEVLKYLETCFQNVENNNNKIHSPVDEVYREVRMNTRVVNVSLNPTENEKWTISSIATFDGEARHMTDHYNFVSVCNGHFSKPFIPDISGIQDFKGNIIHSAFFDNSMEFANRSVLVVGTKSSGTDIAREVSQGACTVYVSCRDKTIFEDDSNHHTSNSKDGGNEIPIILKPDISSIDTNGNINFVDGSVAQIDDIIFCTGYEYDYPFLFQQGVDSECGDDKFELEELLDKVDNSASE